MVYYSTVVSTMESGLDVPKSSEEQMLFRSWLLLAEFAIAGHPLITDTQTDNVFPGYVQECFEAWLLISGST
jgi:hypothetical protein